MNTYELVLLLRNKEEINQIKDFLNKNKITLNKVDEWGEKVLAYKIKSLKKAFYYLLDISIENKNTLNLRKWLNYNDKVIRYLLLVKKR